MAHEYRNALNPEAAMAADSELEDVRPSTVVVDARDLAVELFKKPWRQVGVDDVQQFLDAAQHHEPLHWEAKGTKLPHPDSLRKTIAGLANREGGFFILGAERDTGAWLVNGIPFDDREPGTWLSQLLSNGIRPAPEFDVRVLWHEGQMAVVVVLVQPIIRAPAMVDGRLPERHSGRTVWVEEGVAAVTVVERVVSRSRGRPLAEGRDAATRENGLSPVQAAPTLSVELDAETFATTLRGQLTDGREAEIEVFLAGALARMRAAVDGGDGQGLARELDRVTDCAAVALTLSQKSEIVARSVNVLRESFDLGLSRPRGHSDVVSHQSLWLRVLTRVRAIGGLAVRLGRWGVIRQLTLHQVHDGGPRLWPTWLRYGEIHVSRARLYWEGLGNHELLESSRRPLRLAADQMADQRTLHPDGVVDERELISAVCQFDFLVNAVVAWEAREGSPEKVVMPYYAAWEADRVQPIADRLVSDHSLRNAVLPDVEDSDLAVLLRSWGFAPRGSRRALAPGLFGMDSRRGGPGLHHPTSPVGGRMRSRPTQVAECEWWRQREPARVHGNDALHLPLVGSVPQAWQSREKALRACEFSPEEAATRLKRP